MKTKFTVKITALLLVLVTLFSLTACDLGFLQQNTPPIESPKDKLQSGIENTPKDELPNYSYVYQYLLHWGISGFNKKKIEYFEAVFKYYYNYEDGLPETLTHAEDTAKLFLEKYYDTIDLEDAVAVTDAILYCYVYSIEDPYSYYRNMEEFQDFKDDMSGTFGGVGIQVEYNHNEETILVNQVFKDGPADIGGMKVGDYIVAVDGKSLDELGGYDKALNYVRGEIGTNVIVTVERHGTLIDITMTRALIEESSVEYALTEEGYGYILITSFKANTAEQFINAIEELEDLGAIGYIFDLRSNPGGYVYPVVDMMSYILPTGNTVISYSYKNQPTDYDKTHADELPDDEKNLTNDHVIDLPMVIICNEYTASAAEMFVSCLRDYRNSGLLEKVTIVGKTTFGKGIMQGSIGYSDDSYVTLTVAYHNPPSGINYHGIGIAPDIEVEYTESGDAQLEEAIKQMDLLIKGK